VEGPPLGRKVAPLESKGTLSRPQGNGGSFSFSARRTTLIAKKKTSRMLDRKGRTFGSIYCHLWKYILLPLEVHIDTFGSIYCYLWKYILSPLEVHIVTFGSTYCYLWKYILLPLEVYIVTFGSTYCYLWKYILLPLEVFHTMTPLGSKRRKTSSQVPGHMKRLRVHGLLVLT
jgi:hypothetical protein